MAQQCNDYKFEDDKIMRSMIYEYDNNNKPLRVVAKQFHVNVVKLSNKLKEHGIDTSRAYRGRKHSHNEDYFKSIDNHEKAYWLGLIMADGCVYSTSGADVLKLTLHQNDLETITNFKKALSATNPIQTHTKTYESGNKSTTCSITIRSQITCDHLQDKGVIKRKSLIKEFPTFEKVPEEFIYSYIRGYMDGNGSIRVTPLKTKNNALSLRFTTSQKFAEGLQNIIGGTYKQDSRGKNAWEVSLKRNETEVILKKIYEHSTPETRMKRKYEKFLYRK